MENKLISRTILLFSILIILQFQHVTPAADEGGQNVAQDSPQKPRLSKLVMDTVSLLRKSHQSSWEKIKTVIHDLQMQISPPNLDFRGKAEHEGMKEAAEKSFDKSKESVEGTAKSAAEFVGEAIHKTKDKVKESTDSDKDSKAEL